MYNISGQEAFRRVSSFALLAFLLSNTVALAQAPELINFQAQISSEAISEADLVFALYDAGEGGTKIWEEAHDNVLVNGGAIRVLLGSSVPFGDTVFENDGDRFLEIVVNGAVMRPRFQITSVAFALRANSADKLNAPVVGSINGLSNQLTLEAGKNVEIETDGQTLRINAVSVDTSTTVSGIESLLGGIGINVVNADGPTPEVSIEDDSITDAQIQDGGVTRSSIAAGTAVLSLNGITENVTITGGVNVDIDQDGQSLVINAAAEGGGVVAINGGTGIAVANAEGPIATVAIANNSITDAQVKDGSLSRSSLAAGAAVFSINGLSNDIIITGGSNVDVDQSGQSLVINTEVTGDGVGVARINGGTGIAVANADGPVSSVAIANNSITDAQVQDGSLSRSSLASGTAVFSLNGVSDDVFITGGNNVNVDQNGQSLVISAELSGNGGGISRINGGNGITVSNPQGPTSTVSIQNNSITDTQIRNRSITGTSLASGTVGSEELSNQVVLGWDGKLEIQNQSGQIRSELSTVGGNGFMGIDRSDGTDAINLEVLSGAFGMITVYGLGGNPGTRLWGDQTGSGLFGAAMAVFKRDGDHSSTWIRTEGTSANNAWGVIGVSDGSNNEVIRLDGENGDLSVAGVLSKGSGSFKIDHPLDPQNKYLSHSFVESPDMMNIYNGNVILDDRGEAWVELPEWFEALNKDFRYQLTCIGGFAQVYIADEIEDKRFRIAGGTPGLKVSWQVTGVRQDPFAELHRIKVEEEKPDGERGTYLHPEAYGN